MAEDPKPEVGFVPLKSLTGPRPDPATALAEIRRIYFKTTKRTIEHDFAHAIDLLKTLPEDDRDKAAVFMEGIAQMRKEWQKQVKGKKGKVRSTSKS